MQNAAGLATGDPALYDAAVTALQPKFAVLGKALHAGHGFHVGSRFTAADVNVAEIIRYAQAAPELFAANPNVQTWITACQARPAFKAMMADRNTEPL
jgi:glutathione S-transferase